VKAYLHDPTGEKARAVNARYGGYCRACDAGTSPRNARATPITTAGTAIRVRQPRNGHAGVREAMRRWAELDGAAPS
jgi:hypothetical protein